MTGAKVNQDKLVGLCLGTCRGKLILFSIIGQWTGDLVKLLRVWFGSNPRIKKNWSEVVVRVTAISRTWGGRGGTGVYGINHHLPPNRCALPPFMDLQVGKNSLLFFVEEVKENCL